MRAILKDVKEKLDDSQYRNEEQIRMSLVARIIQKLEWDIWDPEEVITEFNPYNDRFKVDIALFPSQFISPLFIEIKSSNKLNNQFELEKAENQLRDYNVNFTALFTILTDGNQWRFYYSQSGGTFSQKCFKVINIQEDDFDDTEIAFLTFLNKEGILNGKAKEEAQEYLQLTRKQRIMEESLATAKREQDNNPLLNLVDALCNVVKNKGLRIKREEAIEFLQNSKDKKHIKLKQTSISTSPQERVEDSLIKTEKGSDEYKIYSINNPLDLRFTKIESGKIENETASNWQQLVRVLLKKLIHRNISIHEIRNIVTLNLSQGVPKEGRFGQIPETNFSLQLIEANVAGKAIAVLSKHFNIDVEIEFIWMNKPRKAAFPNEKGKLIN